MKEFVDNFTRLAAKIAQEKGDLSLFALVLREDAPNRWDLLIAASWIGEDKVDMLNYVVDEIKSTLGTEALLMLSRIVLLEAQNPAVQELNTATPVENGKVELRDSDFFGLPVERAYIIASKRPAAA
ncbi:MAG: hypothetical protein WCD37_00115 [Chloroflexia bacterium]